MIAPMLDLSTGHMPSSTPDFGKTRHAKHDEGYVVFVNDDDECPEWLQPIMKFAEENSCMIINFDSDGATDDRFKEFDW